MQQLAASKGKMDRRSQRGVVEALEIVRDKVAVKSERPKRKARTDKTGIDIPEAVDADKLKKLKSVSSKKYLIKRQRFQKWLNYVACSCQTRRGV